MGSPFSADVQTEAALIDQVAILGRKTELRQLIKTLTLCRSGQAKAILLTGNQGIGKSALLSTFCQLAEHAYGCQSVSIVLPPQATAHQVFTQTVREILSLSNRLVDTTLQSANVILTELGLYWTQADLIRIVALVRLQESVGSRQSLDIEQLTQAIMSGVSFFKRFSPEMKASIEALAKLLSDPWVALAVSMASPMNPSVQTALTLVSRISGESYPSGRLLASSAMPLLGSGQETPEPDQQNEPNPSVDSDESVDLALSQADAPPDDGLPSLTELQGALSDLLAFINNGLRQHQTAFVLAFDQWEHLATHPETTRKDACDLLNEVIRRTVDQRDFRLMLFVACRSEVESYAISNGLYNALRAKTLVTPLAVTAQQRFLKDSFKAAEYPCDDAVLQDLIRLNQGNPAWLTLMARVIQQDMQQSGLHTLDEDTYRERYAVKHPEDMLETLFTRLQLGFVGEDSLFLKGLGKLTTQLAARPFERQEALRLLADTSAGSGLMARLIDALVQHGFLQPKETRTHGEPVYQFHESWLLTFLLNKVKPLQDDIPTVDKVASLKKVLPLSIQSGELSRDKTQELLAMASALDNPELVSFVEQALVDALSQPDVTPATQIAVLESLPLLASARSLQAMLSMLQEDNAQVRESACIQLIPLANRLGLPVSRQVLVEAMLPLVHDPVTAVRYQAYQFLSLVQGETDQVLPVLLEGAKHPDYTIRMLSLTGLAHQRVTYKQVFELFRDTLEAESDLVLFKTALKGLQHFDRDIQALVLTEYLEKRTQQTPFVTEALSTLMHTDLSKAMPWISAALEKGADTDFRLSIIKRLGTKPNPQAEKILIRLLRSSASQGLAPELRWMTIRSLGWIAQTEEALNVLESQTAHCMQDEILAQALKSAIAHVTERMPTATNGHGTHTPDDNGATLYAPVRRFQPEESGNGSTSDPTLADPYIDLVVAARSDV